MKLDRVTLTHARVPPVGPFRISNGVLAPLLIAGGDGAPARAFVLVVS